MLSLLFVLCLIAVFGEVFAFAIRAAWGITKIVFTVVFFPLILVGLVLAGLIYIAIPMLAIIGAFCLFGMLRRA